MQPHVDVFPAQAASVIVSSGTVRRSLPVTPLLRGLPRRIFFGPSSCAGRKSPLADGTKTGCAPKCAIGPVRVFAPPKKQLILRTFSSACLIRHWIVLAAPGVPCLPSRGSPAGAGLDRSFRRRDFRMPLMVISARFGTRNWDGWNFLMTLKGNPSGRSFFKSRPKVDLVARKDLVHCECKREWGFFDEHGKRVGAARVTPTYSLAPKLKRHSESRFQRWLLHFGK